MILTHRKFNDICARFLVIMKNVVISFIKEYLRLPCDVIDDVVIMKKLFWHNLERFFHIWGQIEDTRKIAISISDILSSQLQLKYWRRSINFKIWPTLWPGDVINDVMNEWNITCTTRHPQQCTCKILFVWHQSFIVKSSGQTSWQT